MSVYASLSGPAIDLQKMPILTKKIFIWWSSFWSWRVCKQAKLSHLVHRKPVRIHWKADVLKTSHCFVRILVQRHNWAIFNGVNGDRYRAMSTKMYIFVHKNWRGGYWQYWVSKGRRYVPHRRSYTRCFAPCFWRSHYQPRSWCRSCNLTPLDYYLWGAVKNKCYADKPETIDVLRDNIRKAIGEIQLHTTDYVLKNWTDRVGYDMASRGSHLNEIIFHY